ncbi:MAG: carbohydrate kinase, partial [Pseudacidovorax sp.]|nr:carbohydrate kinase [Pseudacidovorax sp.]
VCGEALMDVYVRDSTPTGLLLDARVGGSPFNVAVGLARLGQPVQFLAGLSLDVPGERLTQSLRDEGVGTALVVRRPEPTTLSVVTVGRTGVPSYAFHGQGAADRALGIGDLPALPAEARALHLGSYAMVVAPIGDALRDLVLRERAGRLISYDPNVRLNVEPDVERWRAVVEDMAALSHVIKVSDEDLGLLYPDQSCHQVAARWLGLGARLVVVTRGATGSEAWNRQGHAMAAALLVDVVDTVGAGDTFQAALLTWLAEHDAPDGDSLDALESAQMAAMLRFSARAASITCSRRGSDMPRRGEVD